MINLMLKKGMTPKEVSEMYLNSNVEEKDIILEEIINSTILDLQQDESEKNGEYSEFTNTDYERQKELQFLGFEDADSVEEWLNTPEGLNKVTSKNNPYTFGEIYNSEYSASRIDRDEAKQALKESIEEDKDFDALTALDLSDEVPDLTIILNKERTLRLIKNDLIEFGNLTETGTVLVRDWGYNDDLDCIENWSKEKIQWLSNTSDQAKENINKALKETDMER